MLPRLRAIDYPPLDEVPFCAYQDKTISTLASWIQTGLIAAYFLVLVGLYVARERTSP